MKKGVRIFAGIVCLPIALIGVLAVLIIGWEILGAVVNNIFAQQQTKRLEEELKDAGAEVLGGYSYTGNTGDAGNHVDMLSVVFYRTLDPEGVKRELDARISGIVDVMSVEDHRLNGFLYYIRKLKLPEDKADCYAAVYVESAPFADNIAGH